MTRVRQPSGHRGSLGWMQRAGAQRRQSLELPILQRTGATRLQWLSPLALDEYAEYRDGAFMNRIGHAGLQPALAGFRPLRGPRRDASATTDAGDMLLVEAGAHVQEMFSPASAAGAASMAKIDKALRDTAAFLGASKRPADRSRTFCRLSNRRAHPAFRRRNGVKARLVLVGFVQDHDMGGPDHPETSRAAIGTAVHALGLALRHAMSPQVLHVLHVCPNQGNAS